MPIEPKLDDISEAEYKKITIKLKQEVHNRLAENTVALKENTAAMNKLALEVHNSEARRAIDRRTPESAPPPSQPPIPRKMTKCGSATFTGCGAEIYWKDKRPFNADGSEHHCQR
jgi:hypothetical protein